MKTKSKHPKQLTRKQMQTILGGDEGYVIDRDKRKLAKNCKKK